MVCRRRKIFPYFPHNTEIFIQPPVKASNKTLERGLRQRERPRDRKREREEGEIAGLAPEVP